MTRLDRCFVTGCDAVTEWQLEWFLENYRKHNHTPIVFCDFGVSPKVLRWVQREFDHVIPVTDFERERLSFDSQNQRRWFLKPLAMLVVDAHEKVWLDTDCEVLGHLSGIFDYLVTDRITVAHDKPWSKRRGEIWHNTGVFGVIGKPKILYDWFSECKATSNIYTINNVMIGDQDALHNVLGQDPMSHWLHLSDLPNKYNWLRIQLLDGEDSQDKLIMHWTGPKGSDVIRKKMNG